MIKKIWSVEPKDLMKKSLIFFKECITQFKKTGAVCPSSPSLQEKMLEQVDFSKPLHILELGPGNGCITEKILKKMHPDSTLSCIEINPNFCAILEKIKTDKNFKVLNTSVYEADNFFAPKSIDWVISSLPLKNFSEKEIDCCLDIIKTLLKKEGQFVQFQYSKKFEQLLVSHFSDVKKDFVLFNIPPAFIYSCSH